MWLWNCLKYADQNSLLLKQYVTFIWVFCQSSCRAIISQSCFAVFAINAVWTCFLLLCMLYWVKCNLIISSCSEWRIQLCSSHLLQSETVCRIDLTSCDFERSLTWQEFWQICWCSVKFVCFLQICCLFFCTCQRAWFVIAVAESSSSTLESLLCWAEQRWILWSELHNSSWLTTD